MENSSSLALSSVSAEAAAATATASSAGEQPVKKKRSLPGTPDPYAEVIALSPKTLLETNRFVCEICNKGFQRDQNLQLHRRGHNLPWKLKQRTGGKDEVRKRVYVCPEPTCVHHNPARALGDLTGIRKHFCRKHGEKNWKCKCCSKKYAVQSDWKAHMKTCGTKEYKCDCGKLFSRRDSFITHRAFCDALAVESSRVRNSVQPRGGDPNQAKAISNAASLLPPPLTPSTTVVSPVLSIQSSDLPESATELLPPAPAVAGHTTAPATTSDCNAAVFSSIYSASPSLFSNMDCPEVPTTESTSLTLFLSSTASSIFLRPEQDPCIYAPSPQPAMSATALLQKAAQMGVAASNSSLLRGLGIAMSSSSSSHSNDLTTSAPTQWSRFRKAENNDLAGHVLGLGLPSQESSGMSGLTMDQSTLFSTKPMTLDFLGLGEGPSGAATVGLSGLLTSLEGGSCAAPPTSLGGAGGRRSSREGAWRCQPEKMHGGPSLF